MAQHGLGFTIWIVGLSSSGKSTLGRLLEKRLLQEGRPVVLLEPTSRSELFKRLLAELGFHREGKNQITLRLGYVAKLINQAGGIAIVPWTSPEQWARDEARKEIGRFVEVFMDCPIEVCAGRDARGLYAAAKERVTDLVGVHDPFDPPLNPDVRLRSDTQTPEEEVEAVLEHLKRVGYLSG